MIRRLASPLAVTALAAVVFLAVAPSAHSQMYFGGRAGGGYRAGGYGFSPGYYGGYRSPGYYGYSPGYSGAYYQPHFNQFGYQWNFRSYAPYSIYNYGYYQPFGTALYSDLQPSPVPPVNVPGGVSPNPAAAVNAAGGTSTSAYAPGVNTARFTVRVPDDAQLWIDNVQTQLTGPVRVMTTPSLQPGQGYYYVLRAQWNDNGRPVTQERTARFRAGDDVTVDFTRPDPTAAPPPANPTAPPLNPVTPPA